MSSLYFGELRLEPAPFDNNIPLGSVPVSAQVTYVKLKAALRCLLALLRSCMMAWFMLPRLHRGCSSSRSDRDEGFAFQLEEKSPRLKTRATATNPCIMGDVNRARTPVSRPGR